MIQSPMVSRDAHTPTPTNKHIRARVHMKSVSLVRVVPNISFLDLPYCTEYTHPGAVCYMPSFLLLLCTLTHLPLMSVVDLLDSKPSS